MGGKQWHSWEEVVGREVCGNCASDKRHYYYLNDIDLCSPPTVGRRGVKLRTSIVVWVG